MTKYIPVEVIEDLKHTCLEHLASADDASMFKQIEHAVKVLDIVLGQKKYTDSEIHRMVAHEYLLEDARNFTAEALADKRDCDFDDITDAELDEFDKKGYFEKMAELFEKREDAAYDFNSTMESAVHCVLTDNGII